MWEKTGTIPSQFLSVQQAARRVELRGRVHPMRRRAAAVVIGVDGVSDFNALHSGKHNEKVQLCAFDVLALDGDDYLDALPRAPHRTDRVGRTRSAANGEGALLPKLLIFFRYGQADAEKRSRACLAPNLGFIRMATGVRLGNHARAAWR